MADGLGLFWSCQADYSTWPDDTYTITIVVDGAYHYQVQPTVTIQGGAIVATTPGVVASAPISVVVPPSCIFGGIFGGTSGPFGVLWGPWSLPAPAPGIYPARSVTIPTPVANTYLDADPGACLVLP